MVIRLCFIYTLLAIIATLMNLLSQELSIRCYTGWGSIAVSIFMGTAVGLVTKYFLDKKFIFRFKADNLQQDTRTFILYTATGVITTAIFWGFEYGAHLLWQTKTTRYLGAIVGLAIGYFIKYQLDKRFVFKRGYQG